MACAACPPVRASSRQSARARAQSAYSALQRSTRGPRRSAPSPRIPPVRVPGRDPPVRAARNSRWVRRECCCYMTSTSPHLSLSASDRGSVYISAPGDNNLQKKLSGQNRVIVSSPDLPVHLGRRGGVEKLDFNACLFFCSGVKLKLGRNYNITV